MLLLDTCALIWMANGDPLADQALTAIENSHQNAIPLQICPISAWEVGMLVSRNRISMALRPEDWFSQVLATPGTGLSDLSPEVMIASSFLPGTPPRDPADRMIIATARDQNLTIVTRDRIILRYAEEGHVKALPC